MKISEKKTKVMDQEPIKSKIVVNNINIEQVKEFVYLGYRLSYEVEADMKNKLSKLRRVVGSTN